MEKKRGRSLSTASFIIWCRSFFSSSLRRFFSPLSTYRDFLFETEFLFQSGHFVFLSLSFSSLDLLCIRCFCHILYIYIWIDAVLIARVLRVCACVFILLTRLMFLYYVNMYVMRMIYTKREIFYTHEWNVMRTFFLGSFVVAHKWFSLYRTHLITYFSLIDFVSSLFSFKLFLLFFSK